MSKNVWVGRPTQSEHKTQDKEVYEGNILNKSNSDEEIKQYHRKRLLELSLKSLGDIPQLDEPTDEQKQWVKKHGF